MPLRDHFHPPLSDDRHWSGFHGAWPAMIVTDLNRRLPAAYIAEPRVHLGGMREEAASAVADPVASGDATGWSPPRPTFEVAAELSSEDVYEVRVFDADWREHVVAAIEIVSPRNKDRPERRRAFVARCVALQRQGVSVTIVDPVTTQPSNLYGDLLDLVGTADPSLSPEPPAIYAAACRRRAVLAGPPNDRRLAWRLEAWAHQLAVGQSLPTLPLWLSPDLAVPLELEATYEETCRALRLT